MFACFVHVLPPPFAAAAGCSGLTEAALDVQQCRGLNEAVEALTFIHLQHISCKITHNLYVGPIGVSGFFFCFVLGFFLQQIA